MTSLVRRSATAGLAGGALVATLGGTALRTTALPEEEVVKQLKPVPVFMLAKQTDDGAAFVDSKIEGNNVTPAYLNQSDAKQALKQLKQKQPDVAKQVEVLPVSLAKAYQLSNSDEKQSSDIVFVPSKSDVKSAVSTLKKQGQKDVSVKNFPGAPLFAATVGDKYVTVSSQQDGESTVPFFFDAKQAQQLIKRFKKQRSDMSEQVQMKVVPLQGVLKAFRTSDNEALKQVRLVPSKESLEFMRSQAQQQQQQGNSQQQGDSSS